MAKPRRKRIQRNLLLFGGVSVALLALFFGMSSDDPRFRLSMATAYVSLGLLGLTLVIGPLNVLLKRPNPVSTNLRRDVGIWGGIVGLAHVVAGLQVHLRGNMIQYFVFPPDWNRTIPLRYDPFGLANWMGLGAALLLLLTLSNNVALRKLGTRRWKSLQRWNYGAFLLTVLHGTTYQLVIESRASIWIAIFSGMVITVGAVQVFGFRTVRRS